jgi:DNA repair protein RadD
MRKTLRSYQQEIVDKILHQLKSCDEPILIDASVGSGKSLILSSVLLVLERAGFKALCLTLNSTLIQQNANTYQLQGGNPGIYCAGLNAKDFEHLVIFASPHSICKNISNNGDISREPFRLIIVDECHNINFHDNASMYMRILNHYSMMAQSEQYSFKIIGLSGTCYRNKAESIVGPNQLFKSKLCSISTSWLIEQRYLVRPYFGTRNIEYDFSKLRVNNMGKFNQSEIQQVVDENIRLTGEIMHGLVDIMKDHVGCFIFASTRQHCLECARSLPEGEWAIITGETSHEERRTIIEGARRGDVRYLVSVNCLMVGIDVPNFDVCAWLRPTESLIMYTQGIGRVLRLSPNKACALVLDYAQNLDRHGDIDDPIINAAIQQKDPNDTDFCIPCYTCKTLNTIYSRRCIGVHNGARCLHYFEFKDCHACNTKNDITSRHCRECEAELIDPNAKLKKEKTVTYTLNVIRAEYWIGVQGGSNPIINVRYITNDKDVFECYLTNTPKAKNILYAKFVKHHIEDASKYYPYLQNMAKMKLMIESAKLKTPSILVCAQDQYSRYSIIKKVFHQEYNKNSE